MMLAKTDTPRINSAIARAANFELTIADLARRSERRAWLVAWGAIAMSLILAGGYFYMLPLKEKVPFLVMADAYTGTSTVARLNDDALNRSITASEAINRSNVAHFVLARESYDVAMIRLRDWTTVYTMSSPEVAAGYTTLHANNNPDSPYNTYGKSRAIRVKILSIVLIGGDANTSPKGATVRFQRSLYDKSSGASQPLDSKLATLEFSYKPNLRMDEKNRIENPLGFQVTSYRVDNDYAASPPLEAPVGPSAMAAPGSPAADAIGTTAIASDANGATAAAASPATSNPTSTLAAAPAAAAAQADGASAR